MYLTNLQKLMDQKGINQKQLAEGIGMSQSGVGLIRNGKNAPQMRTVKRMAEFLDCQIGDLFTKSDDNTMIYIIYDGMFYSFNSLSEFKEFAKTM